MIVKNKKPLLAMLLTKLQKDVLGHLTNAQRQAWLERIFGMALSVNIWLICWQVVAVTGNHVTWLTV